MAFVMHQPVIRQVRGELRVSCECTLQPQAPESVGLNGGGRNVYSFWGVTKKWIDTVIIYNNGEHNGEFGRSDWIGYGRHRAG